MPESSPSSPCVLVVDSGVGGLSICEEIIRRAPALELHYLSDNQAFPYGNKSEDFLVQRVPAVLNAALEKISADIIVIACNTASTVVLPVLRQQLSLPVVGVVPAVKTAAAETDSGVFGLLATPGTVARSYTRELIEQFAREQTVIAVGSSKLVELVESYLYGAELPAAELSAILDEFDQHPQSADIDTVVLGCTHFPLVRQQLAALRPQWQWLDSGPAIANRLLDLLGVEGADKTAAGRRTAWFTQRSDEAIRLREYLASQGFGATLELAVPATGE